MKNEIDKIQEKNLIGGPPQQDSENYHTASCFGFLMLGDLTSPQNFGPQKDYKLSVSKLRVRPTKCYTKLVNILYSSS